MRWASFLLGAATVATAWVLTGLVRDERAGPALRGPSPTPVRAGSAPTGSPAEVSVPAGDPLRALVDPSAPEVPAVAVQAPPATPAEQFDPGSFVALLTPAVRDLLQQDVESENRRNSLAHFIELIGYMPDQEALDRIVVIFLETTRRKDEQVLPLINERWTSPNPRPLEVRAELKYNLVTAYHNELRERLRPYVRQDVFEEAYGRWTGTRKKKQDG